MARLAFYTFGLLRKPWGHPAVGGFEARLESVFAASKDAPGYVGGVGGAVVDDSFRPWALPSYVDLTDDSRVAATISVWEDLESVFAFAYGGAHAEALRKRRDWFVPDTGWPSYCAWWIADGHRPAYPEAVERVAHLKEHGATPFAFDFRAAFDPDGNPFALDRVGATALRRPIPD